MAEEKDWKLTVRLPSSIRDDLEKAADANDRGTSDFVRMLILRAVREWRQTQNAQKNSG